MEKIGTGEGAQAYGHGLYFAENPSVAQSYARGAAGSTHRYLLRGQELTDDLDRFVASSVYERGRAETVAFFRRTAVEEAKNGGRLTPDHEPGWFARAAEKAQTMQKRDITRKAGATYKVEIDAEPHELLDWDKPLSQQSPQVRAVFESPDMRKLIARSYAKGWITGNPGDDLPGSALYSILRNVKPANMRLQGARFQSALADETANASRMLRERGIKGIRYLDQGSRGWRVKLTRNGRPYETEPHRFATRAEAEAYAGRKGEEGFGYDVVQEGTSNYVIFDDKLIKILEAGRAALPMLGLTGGAAGGILAAALAGKRK